MTDTTIADIVPEKVVLDNTEWLEGQDGMGSFKTRVRSLQGFGNAPVTTSAVSQDVGPEAQIVAITTSGTGLGTDLINLVLFPVDGTGFNPAKVGTQIIFSIETYSAAGDSVAVTVGGSTNIATLNPGIGADSNSATTADPGVILDFEGACAVFRWVGDGWCWDRAASDNYSTANFLNNNIVSIRGFGLNSGNGGQVIVSGGATTESGKNGGQLALAGGQGDLRGGDVQVAGGSGNTGGQGGNVIISGGATFTDGAGGSVTISSGSAQGTSGDGGVCSIAGGMGDNGNGGLMTVQGGYGLHAGGNINIDAGPGGDTDGLIIIGATTALPTADPHVANALWNSAGTLKISAG